MTKSQGWKVANVNDIPPIKTSWGKGWHSIRHYFDITGFGVNAAAGNKGESLISKHDEMESGQQELFVVLEGKAEFVLDGEKLVVTKGILVAIEPNVKRQATALVSPTTVMAVGGTPGKAYELQSWETE